MNPTKINFSKTVFLFGVIFIFNACATYKTQYNNVDESFSFPEKEIAHSFYLIGDGGNSPIGSVSQGVLAFKTELDKATKNSTAVFLGDNIYPKGLPEKSSEGRAFAEYQLKVQNRCC